MSCNKSNFSEKSIELESLKFVQELESQDIDVLIEDIISTLKEKDFSVDINFSDNPDEYSNSIEKLIKNIKDMLDKSNKLPFELRQENLSTFTRRLRERLLPPSKTKVDLAIEAIIPSVGMLSQETVKQLSFREVLFDIYGNNLTIKSFGEQQFRKKLLELTIIDTKNKLIVDSEAMLNDRLKRFKADEYLKLKQFVETIKSSAGEGFDSQLIANSYYYNENAKSAVVNAYSIMYNYIQYLKANNLLEDYIKDGWSQKINGKNTVKTMFFDAINAYINLQFFDSRIRQSFGKYININQSYDEPITTIDNTQIYKYTLSVGNAEMIKGWETADYQDAIDQMSGYSQILIESIPLISYDTNDRTRIAQFQQLNAVYFNNAFINLRNAISNMSDGSTLQMLLSQTLDQPDRWIDILRKIFETNNKTIISNLLRSKSANDQSYLNKFDLNILYSVYKQVFNTSNSRSYLSIESDYTKNTGIRKRYPIVGTLLGLINSTAGMNYLELVYDSNAEIPGYKLRVKKKFNSNMTVWDMIKSVNRNTYSRTDKLTLLQDYNLRSGKDEKTATFNIITTFNNTVDPQNVNLDPISLNFSTHILDKKASVTFEKELGSIYDTKGNLKIDLSTQEALENILNNPTYEQQIFLSMLSFIDNMLGTTFSKDKDGLTELREYTNQGGKFSTLLGSAVRALKICEIYNKIEQDPNYQKTEIIRFLKENPDTYGIEFWTRDNIKSFIDKNKRGSYFTVLQSSEIWLSQLSTARMIINGSTSKAVTKDSFGNSLPNFSPTYLGAELTSYLHTAQSRGEASSKLLFAEARNMSAIKSVVIDSEIKLRDGTTKAIKDMSESELIYHAIVDKFHLPLAKADRKTVIIQSTTYSDKTKYVGHEISLSDLGINIYSSSVAENCLLQLYNSVGAFYREIWKNILDDYETIFGTRDIALIEQNLNNIEEIYTKKYGRKALSAEQAFVEIANDQGITVFKDLHYRPGKQLSINELLYNYGEDLYASVDNLRDRLNIERKQFINDLLRTRTNFQVTRTADGKINLQDAIGNFINRKGSLKTKNGTLVSYESQWIKGNRLILAKVTDNTTGKTRDVQFGLLDINANESIELNPFLEAYFSSDILISNNLRFSLTGSEINHKVKGKINVEGTLKGRVPNLFGFTKKTTVVEAMVTLKQIMTSESEPEERRLLASKAYSVIRDNLIYSREAGGQGAQLKRNVIIPATMRHYLQNQIDGVPSRMRIAVIDDVQAVVQNFDGSGCQNSDGTYTSQTIDAHDGFAFINPIMSVLENRSLQDNEVGDMKKNILHGYDHKYGVAVLLKYAAGSMTNAWMRQSEMSPISLRKIFKKMSNERWSKRRTDGSVEWLLTDNGTQSGVVDLLESGYKSNRNCSLNFAEDILEGRSLFYNDKGTTKAITNFGRDGQDYYTVEQVVTSNGQANKYSTETIVYHYFDNEGNHITRLQPIENKFEQVIRPDGTIEMVEKYHTIDSIYELWTAMGGLESLELVDGTLQDSEASLYATTAFVNFVANRKEGVSENADISQKNYDQPLKRAFVGYLVNNSAIKNGAGNQNPTSSFYDDTPFRTITIDTKGHGVQLDADHHADEAVMTEFSQVITSLDAGGRMHNYVRQIYNVLGKVALELSNIEIEAADIFRSSGNKSKIYDLIGRTIMKNMKEGQKGLLKAIMTEIKKEFNLNSDHDLDMFKIPFDDPNIYSQILSTFVSIINRKSIKRQYPGSGMVMMPGYNIETVFDYNGGTYQYEDLVKIARRTIPQEEQAAIVAANNSDFNKVLVQKLLQIEQNKYTPDYKFDWVNPADKVNVIINNSNLYEIDIETIEDYYRFKSKQQREYLLEKLTRFKLQDITDVEQGKQYTVIKGDFITSFIIAPDGTLLSSDTATDFVLIANILVGDIKFQRNVTKARNLAPVKIYWTMPDNSIMNIFDSWAIKQLYETGVRDKTAIQETFDLLNLEKDGHKGWYWDGISKDANGDKVLVPVTNIVSTEAECVVPNIFQSKFDLTNNQSLADILSDPKAFLARYEEISSENYDIVFTKNNNRNTYITFKPVSLNSDTFESQIIPWDDTVVEDTKDQSTGIIQRVFAINKDNVKLFEIARKKLISTVKWDPTKGKGGKFVDLNGNILEDQSRYTRYKGQVLETITFVQKRRVRETTEKQTNNYTLYNINREALSEVYTPDGKHTVEDFLGVIMSDIYNADDYNGVQINKSMTTQSADILRKSLNSFAENQSYNSALYTLIMGDGDIKGLRDLLIASKNLSGDKFNVNKLLRRKALSNYYTKLSSEIRASFEKSLYFTASRIPAQSHQSFMQMKAAGFTRDNVTHTFVSHFQTWLQGSDYKRMLSAKP